MTDYGMMRRTRSLDKKRPGRLSFGYQMGLGVGGKTSENNMFPID